MEQPFIDRAQANPRAPRLKLPPMYTLIRIRRERDVAFRFCGYIYDISESGMRFEMDELLPAGERIEIRAMLPGATPVTFNALGRVVRIHEDQTDIGPFRMGMTFEQFESTDDAARLTGYLARGLAA